MSGVVASSLQDVVYVTRFRPVVQPLDGLGNAELTQGLRDGCAMSTNPQGPRLKTRVGQ